MCVVTLGWAHQVQQKQDLKWFKPSKSLPAPDPAELGAGCRVRNVCAVFPCTLNRKLQTLPKEWDLRSDFGIPEGEQAGQGLLGSCRCLGIGASVSLRCATGRSQSWVAGAPQGPWGHLGKGVSPTHSILHRARAEILHGFALSCSQPQSTVPAVLPLLSRPGHGWQGLFGTSEVLLSWIPGKIFSWKEWSDIGRGCPGRWQSHHPRTEHVRPLVGFGWRLKILELFPTLVIPWFSPNFICFLFSPSFPLCHAPPLSCSFLL